MVAVLRRVAVGFGICFADAYGGDAGTEFFTGYIVEKSLSVDNLFVFVIIMTTFAVREEHQHKVLTFGIVLALVMRAAFIALGATLLSLFSFMFLVFGLLLVYTAVQLFRHRDEDPDVEDNVVVKAARRFLPITDDYVGGQLITRTATRRMVTPLVVVLIAIGSIDLLFALDSIPAIFGRVWSEMPETEHADPAVDWLVDLIELNGGPGVGLAIALENVFPPVPSEVVLPLAGLAAARGGVGRSRCDVDHHRRADRRAPLLPTLPSGRT